MTDYAPAYPHGDIEEIASDVFLVRGSIKMNAMMRITRNMVIVRNGAGELTLVDPIRLNAKGEEQLRSLGTVTNILRLGAFHGLDDRYYVDTFNARLWSQEGGTTYTEPPIDVVVTAETELPFEGGTIVEFAGIKQPECVLHLATGKGLLVTCDAIQNYGDYSYNNLFAKLLMPFIGFTKNTLLGPFWLKLMTEDQSRLEAVFRRLLDLEFDALISAHGTYLQTGANDALRQAVDKVYSS